MPLSSQYPLMPPSPPAPPFAEPPRWTRRPRGGVFSSGSSGILLCEAEGEPEPIVRWTVNGAPLERE